MDKHKYEYKCELIIIIMISRRRMSSHQWSLEEHLPLVHNDLVGAGLRSSKEGDVFVLEGLQRFGFPSFINRHVVSAHTQPQIMREAALFTLQGGGKRGRGGERCDSDFKRPYLSFCLAQSHFPSYSLTSTSNRVDPYPGHSLLMLMYFSMAWCWGIPCSRVHFSRTLVRVADVSSFTHISNICSSSTWNHTRQPSYIW